MNSIFERMCICRSCGTGDIVYPISQSSAQDTAHEGSQPAHMTLHLTKAEVMCLSNPKHGRYSSNLLWTRFIDAAVCEPHAVEV